MEGDQAILKITYPDGNVDFALLKEYNPIPSGVNERLEDVDQCIYNGYLQEESNVYITLVGCANTYNFQVIHPLKLLYDWLFYIQTLFDIAVNLGKACHWV